MKKCNTYLTCTVWCVYVLACVCACKVDLTLTEVFLNMHTTLCEGCMTCSVVFCQWHHCSSGCYLYNNKYSTLGLFEIKRAKLLIYFTLEMSNSVSISFSRGHFVSISFFFYFFLFTDFLKISFWFNITNMTTYFHVCVTHTQTHIHTNTYTQTHTHTHKHTHIRTNAHAHSPHTFIHKHMVSYTYAHCVL